MTALPYDMSHIQTLLAGPESARSLLRYVVRGLNRDVGSKLTSASIFDLENMRSRRIHSDNSEAYPVGNYKQIDRNLFFTTVLENAQPFVTSRIEQIAEVFFDWRKIQALGFESNMNLPAVVDGKVIGTINMLAPAGHFTGEKVAAALAWQPIVTLCFLLTARDETLTASVPEADAVMERA